jgi:short-subunit dehydrogenase
VNLHAPIHLTRTLLPQMLERNEGSVILIGSVAGQIAVPGSSIYSASKFGLRAFADSLRRETARSSIGVTLVAPGFIETDMTARLRGLPMGKPEDVARVVLRAIARPQREVFVPLYCAPLVWLARTWPGLVDAILSWRRR